ncbi:nucleoid occlusion protein [Bacillaceae bacterium W0354]
MSSFSKLFGKSLSEQDQQSNYSEQVVQISVQEIRPNQYQPRTIFDDSKIEELAKTIKTHGIIQPIVVRKIENENGYELIAGERRWRAVLSLGWENIPAIVKNMTDTETASVALIENLQREELTVIEEAIAYDQLLHTHGLTQEALAQRLGKSQSTIANKLRLLKLPKVVQQALLNKEITERHARALIPLKDHHKQEELLELIIEKKLNVKQTEEYIEKFLYPEEGQKKPRKRPQLRGISKDIRIALNTIRQSVNMVQDTGMNVEAEEVDSEDYYKITIKIPKK